MSEFLTVRLSRENDATLSWLVWSTSQNDVIASGELGNKAQLSELLPYAENRTTVLLLDSRDVIVTEVDIPSGASRQFENMLPYLLEENIAQDVEELHFTILNRTSSHAYVAGVDKEYLTTCLSDFKQAGLTVKKVIPDLFAMPLLPDGVSALQMGNTWLFRQNQFSGVAVEQQWLTHFLHSLQSQSEDKPVTVTSYTPYEHDVTRVSHVHWKAAEPELVMALLSQGAIFSSINLLTGTFKSQSSLFKQLKVWRKAAIAAGLFVAVIVAQNVIQLQQFEAQASAYRAESERVFRTVFPDKRKIPTISYLKRQMNDEVARLSGGTTGDSVLDWLSSLPSALEKYPSVEIENIRYDAKRGEVRLQTVMKDFQTFEQVRINLAKTFTVVQGPLSKKQDKVSGSFVLRNKQ
ncbi:type II secretion system protein L [Vibrio sp. MACH09]|uniref:type II secretion system protein GspL n=1 Tax=Vibrio sp. MACH09 TaxID=3025122 RepID=UPI0027935403|nr:type II secretion system protein GspL [Vibrio sp. MACH09]GLO59565.1 type II secretion system protein L [Vibrio sp. MACH09]